MSHLLRFCPDGRVRCLHTDLIDLRVLGRLRVVRATCIEFNETDQQWEVRDFGTRQVIHSDPSRAACLRWEREHLTPPG
jgi:hypothetical protein